MAGSAEHAEGWHCRLLALKEPNMNNPWRQPGVDDRQHFPALKELNIKILVMGKTLYPALYRTLKEVFYTLPRMIFDDAPVDSYVFNHPYIKPFQGLRSED